MINKGKMIRMVVVITTLVLFINIKASAVEFNKNLDGLNGIVTVEDSKSFIEKDKNYLNNSSFLMNIDSQIKKLEKELKNIEDEYETVKGIKIYTGNTGLKNNALRTAIKNREAYKNNKKSFKYDEGTIYNIDRDYTEEMGTNKYFTQKEMDNTYESIVEVIENIELDTEFLNDTVFVVSPFILDGMNGYTVSRSNNHNTIVISNHVLGSPDDWLKISTKSTILHEIGHVFQNSNQNKFKNNTIANEYLVQADKKLQGNSSNISSEITNWKTSVNENFAEDFRTHFSTRLGDDSFKPLAKKTSASYNEVEFTNVINEIIK